MRAGILRHRLEVQQPTDVRDDIGGVRQDWLTVETVWGRVEPLRAREQLEAQKLEARITHQITLRYGSHLQATWRLRLKGTTRVFNPFPPMTTDERNREVKMLAMEVLP